MSVVAFDTDQLFTEALVVAQVIDAASGLPRVVSAAVTATPHAFARIATGSYLVVGGRPELVLPQLASTSYTLTVTLSFPDTGADTVVLTIPAGSVLPYRPADIAVEMPPVSLQGTVFQAAFPHAGIAGAQVVIAAAAPPALLALRTPLSLDHPAGATLSTAIVTTAAPATTLAQAADQAATTVALVSVGGCASGGVLVLGDPPNLEHALIGGVDTAAQTVTVTAPLRRSRALGAQAQAATVAAGGPSTTLARAATAGDGILECTAALAAGTVQVGGPVVELRAAGLVCDADGRWQLDGVRAIGSLTVAAAATGYTASAPLTYDVDYRRPNVIDLSLV